MTSTVPRTQSQPLLQLFPSETPCASQRWFSTSGSLELAAAGNLVVDPASGPGLSTPNKAQAVIYQRKPFFVVV